MEQESKRAAVEAWKAERAAMGLSERRGSASRPGAASSSSASAFPASPPRGPPPDPEALRERARHALEAATAKRAALETRKKAKEDAASFRAGEAAKVAHVPRYLAEARAAGLPGAASTRHPGPALPLGGAGDVFDFWATLPADPARPTTASHAHALTAEERVAATAAASSAPAHAAPVASVLPNARGKSFTFGVSSGARPMLAVPAWRKVAMG